MEQIEINHLSENFGKISVLKDISLKYNKGMIYGLIGENGAGKTTLFKCMMGLYTYTGEIKKAPDIAIGYLPADNFFYTLVTGLEYLQFCIKAKDCKIDYEKIKTLNGLFNLPLNRYASDYSTGMKKKLALMALLLQENDVYILDEPFNGIDLKGCIQLKKIIKNLKNEGKTIIISSHLISSLHEICETIHYLNRHIIYKEFHEESIEEIEAEIINSLQITVLYQTWIADKTNKKYKKKYEYQDIRNMKQMIHNYQTSIDKDNINIEENVPVNLIKNVPINLTKREKQILKLMKINDTMTIHELSEIFELNEKTIRRDLAFLRNQHLLVRIGANKNGKWIVMNDSSIRL